MLLVGIWESSDMERMHVDAHMHAGLILAHRQMQHNQCNLALTYLGHRKGPALPYITFGNICTTCLQVVGCKYVRLYDPQYTAQLYPHVEGMHTNTSRVDVEAVDEALYPEFSDVPYMDVLLEPDSMLYMPPKWWHYIKSVSVSFSVSFWWS